jgi:hypothetical protein
MLFKLLKAMAEKGEIGRYRPGSNHLDFLCRKIFELMPYAFEVRTEGDDFVVSETDEVPGEKNRIGDIRVSRDTLAASLNTDASSLREEESGRFVYVIDGKEYGLYVSGS